MSHERRLMAGDGVAAPLAVFLAAAWLPHVARQPVWVTLWVTAGLGASLMVAGGRLRAPGRRLLGLLALAGVGLVVLSFGRLFGPEPGVAALAVLLALKPLEAGTDRDRITAVFLGLFLVIFAMFADQSLAVALYLGAVAVVGLAVMAHVADPARPFGRKIVLCLSLAAQAVPLAAVLFLVFPRLPSLGFIEAGVQVSGLSDTLEPGRLSRLALSRAPAFRVNFTGRAPARSELYWRGLVLWIYRNGKWLRWQGDRPAPALVETGSAVVYDLIQEPSAKPWLFSLDTVLDTPAGARLTPGRTLLAPAPLETKRAMRLRSAVDVVWGPPADYERTLSLRLPKGGNPRARKLAATWARESHGPQEVVRRMLAFFAGEPFVYTLDPPALGLEDPVDVFLFETRRGFCGHYASAAAFLLRAAGVPARVVMGYQGGERSPLGGYWVVRQSDAHAWIEVVTGSERWRRIDPTAAVAPGRIEQGAQLVLDYPAGEGVFSPDRLGPLYGIYRRAGWVWDAANHYWNREVMGYDEHRQQGFWSRLGIEADTMLGKAAALLAGLVLAAAAAGLGIFLGVLSRRRRVQAQPPEVRAYARFCRRLRGVGLAPRPDEGPLDHLDRLSRARPDLAASAREIVGLYVDVRYAGRGGPEAARRLRRLVRAFRPAKVSASAS